MNGERYTREELEEIAKSYPTQIVVMLYDEAIGGLHEAIAAIAAGDIEARFFATKRTADALGTLAEALDPASGDAVAAALSGVYEYVLRHLPMINVHDSAAIAQQAIGLLVPIRNAWFALDDRIKGEVDRSETVALATDRVWQAAQRSSATISRL